jgi:hypothetical protein
MNLEEAYQVYRPADNIGSKKTTGGIPYLLLVDMTKTRDGETNLHVLVNELLVTSGIDVLKDMGHAMVGILYSMLKIISPPDESMKPLFNVSASKSVKHIKHGLDPKMALAAKKKKPGIEARRASFLLDRRIKRQKSKQILMSKARVRRTNIKVSIPNPTILLLDDPEMSSSMAFLCTAAAEIGLEVEKWGGTLNEVNESINVCLKQTELYVVGNVTNWLDSFRSYATPPPMQLVCNHFPLDVQVRRRLERHIVLTATIVAVIGDVDMILSLEEIALAQSVVSRGSITDLPPSERSREGKYCIFGASVGATGTPVDLYDIAVTIGTLGFTAISNVDENTDKQSPIVRGRLDSGSFSLKGAMHPRIFIDNSSLSLDLDVHDVDGLGSMDLSVGKWAKVVMIRGSGVAHVCCSQPLDFIFHPFAHPCIHAAMHPCAFHLKAM